MKTVGTCLCGALLLAATLLPACKKDGGGNEACAPLESTIADAEALADERLEAFRSGLREAVAAPPAAGTTACGIDVNRGLATHRAVRADGIDAFEPFKVRDVRGGADGARLTVQDCELHSADSRQSAVDDLQTGMELLRTGHDLVVLEQSRVEPVVVAGTGSFTPGHLQARLLVWSYAESRFVCVADASATNRNEVGVSNQRLHSDYLNEDLDRQVAMTGAQGLRTVAP